MERCFFRFRILSWRQALSLGRNRTKSPGYGKLEPQKLPDQLEGKSFPDCFRSLWLFIIYSFLSGEELGIRKFNISYDLSENTFAPTYTGITYSPVILSENLSAVSIIDDNGILNIFNKDDGRYIYSKYIGVINRPFLKIAEDYEGKSVFIPVSSPAKIACFSLEYAISQKRR